MDYRIRYYFGITPAHELAAYYGARRLTNDQPIPQSVCLGAYREGDAIIVFDLNSGKGLITGSANLVISTAAALMKKCERPSI